MVIPLLVLNWFGDSLDGTLARVRRQERPRYGYYVDHVLDAAGFAALFGGLMLGGHMSPTLGLAFLAAYYLLVVEISLATHARGTFKLAFLKVGPTELSILLAIGTLRLMHSDFVSLAGTQVAAVRRRRRGGDRGVHCRLHRRRDQERNGALP